MAMAGQDPPYDTDEPDEVHFLRVEEDGRPRLMVNADLMHPYTLRPTLTCTLLEKSVFAGLSAETAMGRYP
jgi:hypothetical protein